ncbi:MAG: CoA-binding protein [Chitinophagaceae bacterium]
MSKKTVVIGASDNPDRYSYLAVQKLRANEHEVIAIGKSKAVVADVTIETEPVLANDVDTVTLYVNPILQKNYYDYILSLKPKRIIFNPGTENEELSELAFKNNIQPFMACTLVMLGTKQY